MAANFLFLLLVSVALVGQTLGSMTQFTQGDTYVKVSSSGRIAVGKDQTEEDGEGEDGEWMPMSSKDPSEVSVHLKAMRLLDSSGVELHAQDFSQGFHLESEAAPGFPGVVAQGKRMQTSASGGRVWVRASALVKPGTLYPGTPMEEAVDEDTVIFDVRYEEEEDCEQCPQAETLELDFQLRGQNPVKVQLHPEPGTKLVEMGGGKSIVLPGRYITVSAYPNAKVEVKVETGDTRSTGHVTVALPVDRSSGKIDVAWGGRIKMDDPNAQAQENQVLPQEDADYETTEGGATSLRVGAATMMMLGCIWMVL